MTLWAKTQQLPAEAMRQVRSVYGEHFPIEVRHFLSGWIEDKMWTDIEPDNPQYEQYIANLVGSLVQELESKAASLNTEDLFLTKLKLMEAAKMFRQRYSQNPATLFRIIRHCLGTEMKLVAQVENIGGALMNMAGGRVGMILGDAVAEIAQQVEALRRRTQETGEDLRRMEQEQEAFAISYHECTKLNTHLQHLATQAQSQQNVDIEKKIRRQKEQQEQVLNHKVTGLMQLRLTLADKLKDTITQLNSLQSRVLDDELIRWKRDQQLAGNGASFNSNLDSIQEWCESLAELIWHNRQQIKEAERLKQKLALDHPGVQDILPALNSQITQLLSSLVTSTFIIEKQPPQVMKTNTRFTSTVRLLVGGKLNVHMTPPQVKVSIISEAQANALLKSDKMAKSGEASGEILNNTGTMEYHQATRQLSVSFRNMQLKKIKRAEKKGTESVMDEKFSLLFQSQFSVGGGELVFQVWTLSLPVVVIVHGNQEPHAWATVTWDNAFAEPGRVPFAVPDKVPWAQVAEALNVKFRSATGRPLTEDNLQFLGEKAFRGGNSGSQDYSGLLLSWAQFCKEPLPERNFTFWEWFYAVMKLTREHLRGPWMDGYILGFVRKKQAEEMLASCASGTFLMRFSDSELGGVTIAWVGDQTEVFMLQPFTSKDFAIRSLADRVSDLQHLMYLFPDLSKDHAFSKYYTPFTESQPTSNNGYVKPLLVTHVPGWGGVGGVGGQTPSHSSVVGVGGSQGGLGGSYPTTPSSIFQPHSPDPSVTRDTASVASRWKQNQQSAGKGAPFHSNLDSIEKRCQSLVNLVWCNREHIKKIQCLTHDLVLDCPGVENNLPALNSQITQVLSSLVTNTFIITEQPPQVMKTNTRFTSTVRLLVGGEFNIHMTPPEVKISIISKAQANVLLKSGKMPKSDEASREILNNAGTMEYQPEKQQLSLNLSKMQLKKIKRADRRGAEFVTNEKFSLLFQSEFSVGYGELACLVWTLSLPVVVIVHGNQESHAWATVTWDNASAEHGRVPFAVVDKVPWAQVGEALSEKFRLATDRPLTDDNLRFLGEKVFRGGNSGSQDYSRLLLSRAQFCEDPLPGRSFTFCDWFYAVMKLTKKHLEGPWMDGHILGFVGKKQAEGMLASSPPGTFLIRFSDSQLGAIVIASMNPAE